MFDCDACVFVAIRMTYPSSVIVSSFDSDLVTKSGRVKLLCRSCRDKQRERNQRHKNSRDHRAEEAAKVFVCKKERSLAPTTPRDLSQKRGIYWDTEQYEHRELVYLTKLGVSSYAEVTEERLSEADPETASFFRSILCEAIAADDQIKTYADLMPKSEIRYDDQSSRTGSTIFAKKKSKKYIEDSDENSSVSSTGTINNLVKRRKHTQWLHRAFLNIANILSHIVDHMVGSPIISAIFVVVVYLYLFNLPSVKIFVQEFLLGAARGTLKAIQGSEKDIDSV